MSAVAGVVSLSMLWSLGSARPVGLGLGGSMQVALTGWEPTPCCNLILDPSPPVVPTAGLDLRLELRSMRTPWLGVATTLGAATPELASSGWHPTSMVRGQVGFGLSPDEHGLLLGGVISKDLSRCFSSDCQAEPSALMMEIGGATVLTGRPERLLAQPPVLWASGAARLTPLRYIYLR